MSVTQIQMQRYRDLSCGSVHTEMPFSFLITWNNTKTQENVSVWRVYGALDDWATEAPRSEHIVSHFLLKNKRLT